MHLHQKANLNIITRASARGLAHDRRGQVPWLEAKALPYNVAAMPPVSWVH